MGAIVDYEYYSTVYMGKESDEDSFPALCARACDVIGALTRWAVTDETVQTLTPIVRTLVKKAVCAQVDFFALNGLDSLAVDRSRGFTVGKVSVTQGNPVKNTGKMADFIAPLCMMYLEQSGLMGPQVATVNGTPLIGGWFPC